MGRLPRRRGEGGFRQGARRRAGDGAAGAALRVIGASFLDDHRRARPDRRRRLRRHGALVASRKQMDVVGFVFLGTVTGIGGGTLRDLVLGQTPVFWVREPIYLLICAAMSVFVFFAAHVPRSRLCAAGLARCDRPRALLRAGRREGALAHGPVVAATMGVITAVMGGIIRDILGGESPVIFRARSTPRRRSRAPSSSCWRRSSCRARAGDPRGLHGGAGLRGLALRNRWSLPVYRPREARKPEDVGL